MSDSQRKPALNKCFDRVRGVELGSLTRNSSFERNTFQSTETVVEFTDKKAWKMAEVGNKPDRMAKQASCTYDKICPR